MVSLLLASTEDPASMNMLAEVMDIGGWGESQEFDHGRVNRHSTGNAEILLIDSLHIWADGVDSTHTSLTGSEVDEVLVLSRHVSASNTPALTLHAVGVPGEFPHGVAARSGGITGTAVPPSTRFGELFRNMCRIATEDHLENEYDLTLEATHHGPVLAAPTLYLEIGSTMEQWEDVRAARVWSKTIAICLGLSKNCVKNDWQGVGEVMIGLGGGHYAPRHKAVISASDVWVGHILANYAIVFEGENEEGSIPAGPWSHSIRTAVESTRSAFPGGDIFAHLDRKSFKGWQRSALSNLLSELGVPVLRGKQICPP
ncbi:MAG: D-aminoacyl-tRNA deacylase [Candidatus Thalassarchaeaceae archaeon]|jgi:D-aminoacyl-tRNA deacylase|nr:D-aminoacyl-tRNA deacylase [Candidatus Thalassarchaeaceae archaeon]